jgi:hypothetical protein
MTWVPGEKLRALEKVLPREAALVEFSDARKRIEHEQAAQGVLGGPVAKPFADAASLGGHPEPAIHRHFKTGN